MIDLKDQIIAVTQASSIVSEELVQSLWGGYGELMRFKLAGGKCPSVIVKHIQLPKQSDHPKGWNTDLSHQRKLTSYQVECKWYAHYAKLTDRHCRMPQSFYINKAKNEVLLIMEDLNTAGFSIRLTPDKVNLRQVKSCLTWLAHFHAKFMNTTPDELWPIGTYWHLDTRPDEWNRMQNTALKQAAHGIDMRLNNVTYQTLVHGDAKLANFCFSSADLVAAVDFQYVGRGCGMKDVAYLIGSCFDEVACEKYESELLDHYFQELQVSMHKRVDYQLVKHEWSALYKYAWADFYRFLDGWSPDHWKMHDYSRRLTQLVINELSGC
jgi:hypothetical protein